MMLHCLFNRVIISKNIISYAPLEGGTLGVKISQCQQSPPQSPSRGTVAFIFLFTTLLIPAFLSAQIFTIQGRVISKTNNAPLIGADVFIKDSSFGTNTDNFGRFELTGVPKGKYELTASYLGMQPLTQTITIEKQDIFINFSLEEAAYNLDGVTIAEEQEKTFGITRLKAVEGAAIFAAKKNEVVVVRDITANLATNNSRQIYGKVAGLNIWESDGAGIQLGIGGRGLSPNRSSNFNTRQNGYDISADALGYPESYYTPPVEAIEKIEIVRGAASLQYGTQFGGMVNFKFKEGPKDKKIQLTSRQSIGSFDFFSSFNSIGGTLGKVNYYGFYQYKKSGGWRPNSSLDQHTAYFSAQYQITPAFQLRPEYTFMRYIAQQPGGLTDAQFRDNPRQSNRERNWFKVNWNLFALNLDYSISEKTKINSRFFGLLGGRDALGNLDGINLLDFGNNRDFLSDDFQNWGNETRIIHRYSLFKNPAIFLIGARYYDGFTERRQGEGNDGSDPDFEYLNPENLEGSDFDLPSKNISFFAENIFNLTERFSITPGVRFEHIKTETDGYYRNIVKDLAGNILLDERIEEQRSNGRSFVFFGIGASFKPNDKLELYGNISQNYRAINFNDIRVNVGSLVVDPDLEDERGFNADIGFRGNINRLLNFDVSAFYLAYQDRIGTILKKEPNPQFNNLVDRTFRFRTNVADARILGFESFAELNLLRFLVGGDPDIDFSIFSNLALINAEYTNSQENGVEGNKVELVPEINFKTGFSLSWKDLKTTWQYAHVGEHFSDASNAIRTASAIEGIIPAYHVMDISASYRFKYFQIETGVNNLSNNFYFTRRATGYPGPGIIPSDGRSFYVTLQVQL